MPTSTSREVVTDPQYQLRLLADFGTNNELYGNVLRVRGFDQTAISFEFDEYSHHFCLFHESNPIGVLTSTWQTDGNIDCSDYYPQSLLETYSQSLMSHCKFRIVPSACSNRFAALRFMVRGVWQDELQCGRRLDIVNASREKVRFYKRIGYTPIQGFDFVHPKLGTDSVVLVLPADPTIPSFFRDQFARVPNTTSLTEIQGVCHQELAEVHSRLNRFSNHSFFTS